MHLFDDAGAVPENKNNQRTDDGEIQEVGDDDDDIARRDYWFVHPRDVHFRDWKAFAAHHGCIRPRLEVRYTYASRKYRMVLRDDDEVDISWPPYADPVDSPGIFKLVLVATLHYADGTRKIVTNRVRKYQGPTLAFHKDLGIECRVKDMFPFACLTADEQAYVLELVTFSGKKYVFKPDDTVCLHHDQTMKGPAVASMAPLTGA